VKLSIQQEKEETKRKKQPEQLNWLLWQVIQECDLGVDQSQVQLEFDLRMANTSTKISLGALVKEAYLEAFNTVR
jgi:hypothetical protein